MTLQTSEELKKHESNLSMILFAKKILQLWNPKNTVLAVSHGLLDFLHFIVL